jgi:beta-lactam-binding protein with PASTA domain
MAPREQFERLLRFTLLVFVLATAGFLSAMTAIRISIRGRIVSMPDVVGQPAAKAQQTLAAKGLQFRIADRIYSTSPVNVVVRQSPRPGESIKVPQDAHVVLSLGSQTVTIPFLAGRSMRAARITLLESGLQLGEVSSLRLPGNVPDTVVAQYPPPAAAGGPRVDVLVAQADADPAYVMPGLVGLQQLDAERLLAGAALHVNVNYLTQGEAPRGAVLAQTPPRGSRIAAGANVDLTVAN